MSPTTKLILKAWAVVGSIFGATAIVGFQLTNEWVPDEGDPDVWGIRVSQHLNEDEIKDIAQWTLMNSQPDVVNRIVNRPGWEFDITRVHDYPLDLVQGAFRDIEFSKKGKCLWCLNPKQNPLDHPHYRTHKPNCPVDMVANGVIHSLPIDEDTPTITTVIDGEVVESKAVQFHLQAAPFSGLVWSEEYEAWVAAPEEPDEEENP